MLGISINIGLILSLNLIEKITAIISLFFISKLIIILFILFIISNILTAIYSLYLYSIINHGNQVKFNNSAIFMSSINLIASLFTYLTINYYNNYTNKAYTVMIIP